VKIKYLQITLVAILALVISLSSLLGDVPQAYAQSSSIWNEPINLSNSGGTLNPVIVIDSLGVRHVFWIDGTGETTEPVTYRYTRSEDGSTWSSPSLVNFPFNTAVGASLPVLLSGQNGLIYAFWQDRNESLIFGRTSSENFDDPSLWEFVGVLSEKSLVSDVAMDAQGVIHVAYIRNAESVLGPAGVYYRRSSNDGAGWSDEKLLYASQYFRMTKPEDAHVKIVVAEEAGNSKAFILWDNAAHKRIFMSASEDSGFTWSEVTQLKGPEDTGGYNLPYNVEMVIVGEKSLLVWKVGEPGAAQCAVYSQWSSDGGGTWSDPDTILDYRSICPMEIEFLAQEAGTVVALFNYAQGTPSIVAWNGEHWGTLQFQSEISFFANPETRESIMFGCYNDFVYDGQLFLVGCDLGGGGDIWLTSRSILPISNWLFPSSLWDLPSLLATGSDRISSMVYLPDGDLMHALWMQSLATGAGESRNNMVYSKWDASIWSSAKDVMGDFGNVSGNLAAVVNEPGRLSITWSDERTGNLLFSWASSSKAYSSAEWASPLDLPSPSEWTSSPDMMIDSSGTLIVVYAVPLNEKRGIYLVKSTDNGATWSAPVSVFDAESTGWVMVNRPKIALTGDGHLHVLFNNYSGLTNQPAELYYCQSLDGGVTWSTPDIVSDGSVAWSDIVTSGETVHRIWQQNKDSVVANMDQVSTDGGVSWGKAMNVTGVSNVVTPVTVASNSQGELHLIRLAEEDVAPYIKEYNLSIEDWRWNGDKWESQPFQRLNVKGDTAEFSLAAGISSQGFLSVSLIAKYRNLSGEVKNEIYTFGRSIGDFEDGMVVSSVLPTPNVESTAVVPIAISPTMSVEPTPFPDLSGNSPSAANKNMIGILIILIVVGLVVFIFLRKVKKVQ
jgi:hypothetical protein